MLHIFLEVVLPVFLVAGAAYLIGRWKKIPPGPISQLTIFLFTPCLSFSSLTANPVNSTESLQIVAFCLIITAITTAVCWVIAKILKLKPDTRAAFFLSTVFPNTGNFGLSVSLLAFGQEGLQKAVIFFVLATVLSNTLAVYLASHSGGVKDALKAVVTLPTVYAVAIAVFVVATGMQIPAPVARATQILGQAGIPAMLAVLGLQLASTKLGEDIPGVFGASFIKLVGMTALAVVLAYAMGLDELTRNVVILQSSMPAAVFTVIVATEYKARPDFVTSVVLVSTIGSLLTLTVILALLTGISPIS